MNNKIGPNEKIVLESTTKISLHDRFTALKGVSPSLRKSKKASNPNPPSPDLALRPRLDQPYPARRRSPSPPDYRHAVYDGYGHEAGRNRTMAEEIAGGTYLPPSRGPPSVRFQPRSIQNRLGSSGFGYRDNWNRGSFRDRGYLRWWRPRFGQGGSYGRGFGRPRSFQVILNDLNIIQAI